MDRKIVDKVAKALKIDIRSLVSDDQLINDFDFTDVYYEWIDGESSPFYLDHADEKVVVQKLLDVFSKLDRDWQKEVIEDAEMYLEWQESREEKKKKLKQEVE